MVKQTQSKEKNKVKQTQQITDGSKPTSSQKKKKKKKKTKTQYNEIKNQRTTLLNTNRCWKKERNLT